MRLVKRLIFLILLFLPWLAAALWTTLPALTAATAAYKLQPPVLAAADWDDRTRLTEVRRQIQKHFLAYQIYIPIEDIVAPLEHETESIKIFMQKACGRGKLYIWIPFKFRLPVLGEKVIEWCWKPQTNDA